VPLRGLWFEWGAFKRPNRTEQGVSNAIISLVITRLLGLWQPDSLADLFEPPLSNTDIHFSLRRTHMAKLGRLTPIRFLVFGVLVLGATSWAQTRPPIAEQIAKTYGLDSFGQLEAIRYTFNLQFPGVSVSRSWVWQPKTGQVSFEGKDKDGKPVKVSYVQSQLYEESPIVKNEVDPAFVNDQYWMFFPLHVYWDGSADVQDMRMQKLPLGNGSAKLVSVKYPKQGGYTPGDTWDLYVGPDNRVEDLVYHRGGPRKPSVVIASWTGYKKAGPFLFSTEHRGTADGKPLQISFTNVAVKLVGSDAWINAQ
jgi:hypothetical protein